MRKREVTSFGDCMQLVKFGDELLFNIYFTTASNSLAMSQSGTPADFPAGEQPPSISAAAHAYQLAMQPNQSATPTSVASPAAPEMAKDVIMSDRTPDRAVVRLSNCVKFII